MGWKTFGRTLSPNSCFLACHRAEEHLLYLLLYIFTLADLQQPLGCKGGIGCWTSRRAPPRFNLPTRLRARVATAPARMRRTLYTHLYFRALPPARMPTTSETLSA